MPIYCKSCQDCYKPEKSYQNFYKQRSIIRKDHKNKTSGIYFFYNTKDMTKSYVGQSSDIRGRINNYLNNSYLITKKNTNFPFSKALLKHGQSNFGLLILEYVPNHKLNCREYY